MLIIRLVMLHISRLVYFRMISRKYSVRPWAMVGVTLTPVVCHHYYSCYSHILLIFFLIFFNLLNQISEA